MGLDNKRSGLQIAIDLTIKIYQSLSPGSDKALRNQLALSIFDDQLKSYTSYNRQQRHNARKLLKESMKKQGIA